MDTNGGIRGKIAVMKMLRVKEVAAVLGVTCRRVYQGIDAGTIKAVRLSPRGSWLIPESELRRLLEAG